MLGQPVLKLVSSLQQIVNDTPRQPPTFNALCLELVYSSHACQRQDSDHQAVTVRHLSQALRRVTSGTPRVLFARAKSGRSILKAVPRWIAATRMTWDGCDDFFLQRREVRRDKLAQSVTGDPSSRKMAPCSLACGSCSQRFQARRIRLKHWNGANVFCPSQWLSVNPSMAVRFDAQRA